MRTSKLLCGLVGLWALCMSFPVRVGAAEAASVKNVGVEEFAKLRNSKSAVVLDVRTKGEFASGHMPGALNIDWNSPDFSQQVSKLDQSKTYLVHCAVGGRSARASRKLAELGFPNVYNLEGGISAWQKAGQATEP